MTGFLIALLSGALMSVQGVFNTQVTKTTGLWVSNIWVQLSAFLACLAVWFLAGRADVTVLAKVEPKYMLLGGVIGAGITWTVVKSMASFRTGKSCTSNCNLPADRGVCDRASGDVWCGKIAVCIPEAGRACRGTDRDCNLPVGIERQNCNKCVTGL